LVLAHTIFHARQNEKVLLQDALAHLAARQFAGVELNVDVKHAGCESALLEGLQRHDLLERTLVSSQVPAVLDRVRALEPQARTGISIGGRAARMSQRWRRWREDVLAGLAARRWNALMAHHRLVGPRLLDEVCSRDADLYVWTVNERRAIENLRALGVHGVVSADPRLFV
jgi:glycerophosphoryl diester phosphodiesterase